MILKINESIRDEERGGTSVTFPLAFISHDSVLPRLLVTY
jgi:hypothetical protein